MSITPNPAADFSPVINGYSGIQPFRFWCQKVLPLVYDDSLSYYELLNKVVDYLNHTISDVATAEDNIDKLNTAYNQLQNYVNTYFDTLDVQVEINNKLNDMARSGELDELLSPIVAEQLGGVVEGQIGDVVANQINAVVANQIDDVVEDQLPAQVQTQVPSMVTSWLDDNVDPVGSAVVVDSSLSISGAAADAKTTGGALVSVKTNFAANIESGTDLNTVTTAGNYKVVTVAIAETLLHAPTTVRSYRLIVLESTEIAKIIQIAITNDTTNGGDIYIRNCTSNTWTDWYKCVKSNDLSPVTDGLLKVFDFDAANATAIANGTDLNTITTAGNYKVTSNENAGTMINCPVTVAFSLKVCNISTLSTRCQILIPNAPSTGMLYYRLSPTSAWHQITDERNTVFHKNVILTSSNYATYFPNGSFNDAEPNTIYGISESVVNMLSDGPLGNGVTGQPSNQSVPDSPPATMGIRRGTLITFSQAQYINNASGLVQIFVGYRETEYSPTFAYRIAIYQNSQYVWSSWAKFEENGYLHAGNQIVFGGQPYIQNAPFTDLNDAPANSIYHIDKNMDGSDADHTLAHHPTAGSSSIVITYSFSYTTPHARMQMVCSLDGRMYWRYGYLQASNDYRWTEWYKVAIDDGSFMQNKGRLANGTNLNTIVDNSIYFLSGQAVAQYVNNALANGAAYLTTRATNGIVLQVCEAFSGTRYTRYSENSGSTWSNWV